MRRIVFYVFFLLINVAYGQSWTPWEILYSDGSITVEVSFKNSPSACDTLGKNSKYRYNIIGKLRSDTSFIYWKMEYKDCNGLPKELTNSINIGNGGSIGIVEDMDYLFPSVNAKILTNQTISSNNQTSAQSWTQWETLYSDGSIKVDVSFRNSLTACVASGGRSSKYRYNISGKLRNYTSFVNWKMEYKDCNGLLYEVTNSINIGKDGIDGIVENMDYMFPSKEAKIVKNQISTSSSEKNDIKQVKLLQTILPSSIDGQTNLIKGETTTLSLKGGILGTSAEWKWYESSCNGNLLGSGTSLTIEPSKSTTYFVKSESPYGNTNCLQIEVTVKEGSKLPTSIQGESIVCEGEGVNLSVIDGILGTGTSWVWYEDNCGGNEVGRGSTVYVRPTKKTNYYVRAEGKYGLDQCIEKAVNVAGKSKSPLTVKASNSPTICKGEYLDLTAEGGELAGDAQWVWYENNCGYSTIAGRGRFLRVYPTTTTKYYVRAEGKCNQTSCAAINIEVIDGPQYPESIRLTPSTVYKNKKVNLSVVSNYTSSGTTEWIWIQGDCISGKQIGYGSSITVKCSQATKYTVYGKNNCTSSECKSTTIYPLKRSLNNKSYSSNKILHLGFSIGIESIFVANEQSSSSTSSDFETATGTGAVVGFIFHPIFKEFISLGIGADYSAGTYFFSEPLNDLVKSNIYTTLAPKMELVTGFKKIKLISNYRPELILDKITFNAQTNDNSNNVSFRRDLIGLGLRFGSYSKWPRAINFDLTYNIVRDYEWSWKKFNWNYNTPSSWKKGFSASVWIHNAVNIYTDVFFNSNTSIMPGNVFRIGVRFNKNAFF